MPEGGALILNKTSTEICFAKKMANNGCGGFHLTTKFYKSPNDAAIFVPKKQKTGEKSDVDPEGMSTNKKE